MHISWSFLDKRKAVIKAMESYSSMDFIIKHTDEEISGVRTRMEGIGSPNMDGLPHAHNPQAGEERILKGIEEIDILKERYRQAVEYMSWFKPAWNQLTDDERYVLETFYMDADDCGGNVIDVAEHFGIERSSAYNKKNRAVDHLCVLLYGQI